MKFLHRSYKCVIISVLFQCIIFTILLSYLSHPAARLLAAPIEKQIWAIYIGSWGNVETDNRWIRWKSAHTNPSNVNYIPPGKIPTTLYPQLGLYSSHNPDVIRQHFFQMKSAGIDAAILQWFGRQSSDDNDIDANGFSNQTLELLLSAADETGMKVAVQLEPYRNRDSSSVESDVKYILDTFSNRQSFLKLNGKPVIIIYEPHNIPEIFNCIENLKASGHDAFFISTIVERNHLGYSLEDGFNGIFSYFASDGFTWSSNSSNWGFLTEDCRERGMVFIPAVSPGYNDEKISSWARDALRDRKSGKYYEKMWASAMSTGSPIIVINSFNNWLDGSMIEPAVEREGQQYTDRNWLESGGRPESYMELTKKYSDEFKFVAKKSADA